MSGLQMKYFVVKPAGDDTYAKASRAAIRCYARHVEAANPEFAKELNEWAQREEEASDDRTNNPNAAGSQS